MISRSTRDALLAFRAAREWEQFHTPKNLAIALSVEAAELLEAFQWTIDDGRQAIDGKRLGAIKEEIADLAILLHYLAHDLKIDLDAAVNDKLRLNGERYPVASSRGDATKYTDKRVGLSTETTAARFDGYIGIDYSGAKTPTASIKGLRVYKATGHGEPIEIAPPAGPKRYWTRQGVATWLEEVLAGPDRLLVGIDHGFSFPRAYFDEFHIPRTWPEFLDDFSHHWPTDQGDTPVDFVREGVAGNGAARRGNSRWRRITEVRAGAAKSVFHFDVPGSVAKSTHAGIPWLQHLRRRLRDRIHFWPFDGWQIPSGRSAIIEVYPALWSRGLPLEGRTPDQQDAYAVAATLADADRDGRLARWLLPQLTDVDRRTAEFEGWILGVE